MRIPIRASNATPGVSGVVVRARTHEPQRECNTRGPEASSCPRSWRPLHRAAHVHDRTDWASHRELTSRPGPPEQAESEDLCRRRIRGRVVEDERRRVSGKRKLGPRGAERYDI